MALNIYHTQDQTLMLMQKQWSSQINPALANMMLAGAVIANVELVANTPLVFNHYLGKQMTGWEIVDKTAFADVIRTQPLNNTTLTLESNVDVTISLWVF